ncbi:hypothetical protein LSH36_1090g00105 [Paralvinella palmiformis]|uniref:F-box domain-containing protein n=1 Tax=Paralvinella palmiformis TaxID=53620 RepID=A0AAD9MRU2_9ANNE|nr:hypothetical protein LSH36_1090g00105 [Paralvinella palmiformis]
MAAFMKTIDPVLKQYLKVHKLPEVYEALLSGLAIMCPEDPHQFIVDKLRYIKEKGLGRLEWDMFIEEHMRPKRRIITESSLDYIFNFDESSQPTPEMYEKAYSYYNNKLKQICYNAWMQYHLKKLRKRAEQERKVELAILHHRHRIYRLLINTWISWVKFRKGRQAMAFNKIQHVYSVAIGRVIFDAWYNVTLDAKRTREYFERLERGENMDDDDMFGYGSGEARDDISNLPLKVAVKVFSYVDISDLARCAQVCRSWKVITQSSLLWNKLDLTQVRHRVTDKVATRLLGKCRPYLIHLNLRACDSITSSTFYAIRECRNLQDLNLSECPAINDDTLKMVAEGCKILLYLNVSHNDITDASLRVISKSCGNLQYLSLAFCRKFTDKGMSYLSHGKCAKRLVYLDLSGCLQITPEGFRSLGEGCSFLQSIVLNEMYTLDDFCIQALSEGCKQLKYISVLGSSNLSDEAFKALAGEKKLQKLKIESNQKITDATFKLIGKNCPELHQLYMVDCQNITDASLKSLAACKNLTIINFADCVRITDVGVRHIVDSACGSKIQELNLTNCIRVGDIALVNIHKRCHRLAYLNVNFCEHISEAGIELLGQTHSLTSLDISGCNCGDQGLSSLGNNVRLKEVSLSECVNITDLGLQKFAQQCVEIERLDLSHCQLLTDGAIKNLAFCCRMLTSLNLAGCKLLTDMSVQYLSGVCHYLQALDISGSLHITDKGLKYLRKGCKKLRILTALYSRHITKHAAHKMMKHVAVVLYSDEETPAYYNY